MTKTTDIAVVGGGLNGSLMALALTRAGFDVTLIDPAPVPRRKTPTAFDGRAYAMAQTSVNLLKNLDLWDAIAKDAQPINEIKVTDGRAGEGPSPFFMHFQSAEMGSPGPMGHMVEDRHLRIALSRGLKAQDRLDWRGEERVVAQTLAPAGITLTTDTGKSLTARLAIGCDGRTSGTAQRAGIRRTSWSYDQTGLVCAVAHEKPHGGIAHQFFMPGGPLAILPLTGNVSSIVWSEEAGKASTLAASDDATFLNALRPAFGSFLGEIALKGQRQAFPLGLTLANQFIADRVALVGDAAHGIHPIAGQGLNAGIKDIAALAQTLTEARQRGLDPGSRTVLGGYSAARRFDATVLSLATDTFNRLFSNDNGLVRLTRDLGMGVVNALPGLRRGFMREAAGLSGDLPPLLRA